MEKIKLGVSSCLLGNSVRYDGGHKRDGYIVDTLGQFFAFLPVCPEVECGLSIPRESMRLQGDPESPRLVPLVVPMTMIRHYVRKYEEAYLAGQVYLSPHPAELMLRNHV